MTWEANVYYLLPGLTFLFFIVGSFKTSTHAVHRINKLAIKWFAWVTILNIAAFVAHAINIIIYAVFYKEWYAQDDFLIYIITSIFVWAIILVRLMETLSFEAARSRHPAYLSPYLVLLVGDIFILTQIYRLHRFNGFEIGRLALLSIQIAIVLVFLLVNAIYYHRASKNELDGERQRLLDGEDDEIEEGEIVASASKKAIADDGGWINYMKSFGVIAPYLWPREDKKLQLIVLFCLVLLVLARVVNVLVPLQLGEVTNRLAGNEPEMPWVSLMLYLLYRFLQGNMGVIGALRSWLWIPVGQYTYRSLSRAAFEHVHWLDLDFHLSKRTGEVLTALSKGSSINSVLEQVVFSVMPTIVDLIVALFFFWIYFDIYFALIVAMLTVLYLYTTIKITQWRTSFRRDMVKKMRELGAVQNESISNYETVKYFSAESYEFERYGNAMTALQTAEWHVLGTLNLMNVTQGLIFTIGMMATSLLSAYRVTQGVSTVGSFVTMIGYMRQLQAPLNFFGTYYRSIQANMVDAERMLELFNAHANVTEKEDAQDIEVSKGKIVFDNVSFKYGKREVLKNVSFTVNQGSTVALVGDSGGGKTTLLRLLFRFYDVTSGSISIDGQDIRDLTLNSLRRNIGIVPQDTVLFNESVLYNIRYGKPEASDEECFAAAKSAQIHERILEFPDGYATKVGERGLRLSGGEKQRVAIARVLLKNPRILLLDEATSSLDTMTERYIQKSLDDLAHGRTCITIAHRLSTITDADLILVIQDGEVKESGNHEQLVAQEGIYHAMWTKQANLG